LEAPVSTGKLTLGVMFGILAAVFVLCCGVPLAIAVVPMVLGALSAMAEVIAEFLMAHPVPVAVAVGVALGLWSLWQWRRRDDPPDDPPET